MFSDAKRRRDSPSVPDSPNTSEPIPTEILKVSGIGDTRNIEPERSKDNPVGEQLDGSEFGQVFGGGEDFLGVGEESFLESGGVGDRRVERSDADDGAIKIVKGLFEEDG